MQPSSLLNGIKGLNASETQRLVALAQAVKETIEGVIVPGQVFVYGVHAIGEKYQLENVEIVIDPSVETYRVEGSVLYLNAPIDNPDALTYLSLTEGIGYYLKPETKFREEARTVGTNWVTGYSNELYKIYLSNEDKRSELLTSLAKEFYFLLKNAHPLLVDQYNEVDSFVSDFVTEAVKATDLYAAIHQGLFKVLFDDSNATTFGNIYQTIIRSDNSTGQYTKPTSAEFMTGYLFECLGAISN